MLQAHEMLIAGSLSCFVGMVTGFVIDQIAWADVTVSYAYLYICIPFITNTEVHIDFCSLILNVHEAMLQHNYATIYIFNFCYIAQDHGVVCSARCLNSVLP